MIDIRQGIHLALALLAWNSTIGQGTHCLEHMMISWDLIMMMIMMMTMPIKMVIRWCISVMVIRREEQDLNECFVCRLANGFER